MLWLHAVGCGGEASAPATPPPGRFDAVMVDPSKVTPPAEFCETWAAPEAAKPFVAPPLAGSSWSAVTHSTSPGPSLGKWRWVNVWATWCGPCVAEMPRLVEWQAKLEKEHVPVELVFLSVDAGQAEVDRFYQKEKGLPPSERIATLDALPAWLGTVGLDAGTPIPIHLFVDVEGRTRCVRTGAIGEDDYAAVKRVLGG